jgi:hypothetical protein
MRIKKLFAFLFLLSLPSSLQAACTGESPTWTAADASYAEVKACYDGATAGDTINVPAGSATWSSQLAITKSIYLIGAGAASLTITHGYTGALINISLTSDVPVRISGFYITQSTNNTGYSAIQITGKKDGSFAYTKVRIDNNKFEKGSRAVTVNGWVEGLVDNNTYVNCNIAVGVNGDNTYSWNRPIAAGTENALFIEDNTFVVNNSADREPNEQVYLQEGARTVVRYNNFDASSYTNGNSLFFDSHGNWGTVSGTPGYRGQPITEVYNNTMTGHHSFGPMDFRGGSLLWHHNTVTLLTSSLPYMSMREEEAWTSGGPFCAVGSCPVYTTWASWDNIANSFFWENTFNDVSITDVNYATYLKLKAPATEATFIQKDRDYFIHAPADTGGKSIYPTVQGKYDMTFSSEGENAYYPYSVYTCPHPLVGAGTCDADTAGTAGYTLGGEAPTKDITIALTGAGATMTTGTVTVNTGGVVNIPVTRHNGWNGTWSTTDGTNCVVSGCSVPDQGESATCSVTVGADCTVTYTATPIYLW